MRQLVLACIIAALSVTLTTLVLSRRNRGEGANEDSTRWPPQSTSVLTATLDSVDLLVRARAEDEDAWVFLDEHLATAFDCPGQRFLELVIQNRGATPWPLDGVVLSIVELDGTPREAVPLEGPAAPAARPYLGAYGHLAPVQPNSTRRMLLVTSAGPRLDRVREASVLGTKLESRRVAVERLLDAVVRPAVPLLAALVEETDR